MTKHQKTNRQLMNDEMKRFNYKGDIWFALIVIGLLFGGILGIIWWGNVYLGFLPSPFELLSK